MTFIKHGNLLVLAVLLLSVMLMTECGKKKIIRTKPADGDGPKQKDGDLPDGVPLSRGHRKEINERKQKEKHDLRNNAMGHKSESDLNARQKEFMDWQNECAENEDSKKCKHASERADKFMSENRLKVEDVQQQIAKKRQNRQKKNKRNKRSYLLADSGKWTKCIVPYVWNASLPEADKIGIAKVHEIYEHLTGVRFIYYNGSNAAYNLGHNNYVVYSKNSTLGCQSVIGNVGGNGQKCYACGGGDIAMHEIGHYLGMMHEQQAPGSHPWLTAKFNNINPVYKFTYEKDSLEKVWNHDRFYDISSIMHYGDWTFAQNYGKTMVVNDPDMAHLLENDNNYYMFKTIQEYHQCYDEFSSCQTMPDCDFGGYASVIDGICKCRCPEGLNSDGLCKTEATPNYPTTWPTGKYSMLMVVDKACPDGYSQGNMVHWASAWVWKGSKYYSPGYTNGLEVSHDTCTKTSSSGSDPWPAGKYCILRYNGVCPAGFDDGTIETYGGVQQRNSTGVVPDGDHDEFFEYKYCCRSDGSRSTPISLPTADSFILFSKSSPVCQQVTGMNVVSEYFTMRSNYTAHNVAMYGSKPYIYKFNNDLHNTYFCVYFPITSGCGEIKTFTTETTYTITSPGYPSLYPTSKECMWHFQSPVGTRMQLDFSDFEVSSSSDTKCKAYVEVKHVLPGMSGFKICGHGYKKSTFTVNNYLTMKFFSDMSTPWKGFSATITIVKDDDMCYTGDGSDRSYAGQVNYAKSFDPCLPWKDVKHCLYHAFDNRNGDADLALHNNCRNVGVGTQPWCYTNSETEFCERQNCDACMSGSCYDLDDNCTAIIAAVTNFCTTNEFGEAHRICMQSCGVCTQHVKKASVTTVSCTMPSDVMGMAAQPVKSSYSVGEIVTYTCPMTAAEKRTRTCTSEGTWTGLNYVCGACPTGWAVYHQKCYKWLGWDVSLNFQAAKSACAALNAQVLKVESWETQTFISELLEYDKEASTTVWLGLELNATTGKWYWQDGEKRVFKNWLSGRPDNTDGNRNCAVSKTDGKWKDLPCDGNNLYDVVCEITPKAAVSPNNTCVDNHSSCAFWASTGECTANPAYMLVKCAMSCNQCVVLRLSYLTDTTPCLDQLNDCEAILMATPDMCIKYPDYAWHNCRKTCGVGHRPICPQDNSFSCIGWASSGECTANPAYMLVNCATSCNQCVVLFPNACNPTNDTCTDDANLSTSGERIYGNAAVLVGQYVQYKCNDGYFHTSGSLTRACLPSGSLTGTPPVCSSPAETTNVNLFTSNDIYRRSEEGSKNVALILANGPSDSVMKFTVEGNVTSWTYYSNYVGTSALQVWRPSGSNFQLVGQNIITTVEDRKSTVNIDNGAEQIHAEVGDLVGIWQLSGELSYTRCDKAFMPKNAQWFQTNSTFASASAMVPGTNYLFQVAEVDCRIYSIRATVNPSA